jgi:hypothetical protein
MSGLFNATLRFNGNKVDLVDRRGKLRAFMQALKCRLA